MKTTTTHLAIAYTNEIIIGKPLDAIHRPYTQSEKSPVNILTYDKLGNEQLLEIGKNFYVELTRNKSNNPPWTVGSEVSDLTNAQAKLLTIALEQYQLVEKLVYVKYIHGLAAKLKGFFSQKFNQLRGCQTTHLLVLEDEMPVLISFERNPVFVPSGFNPDFLEVKRSEATGSFSMVNEASTPEIVELLQYAANRIYDQESAKPSERSPEEGKAELISDDKEVTQDQTTQEITDMKKQKDKRVLSFAVVVEHPDGTKVIAFEDKVTGAWIIPRIMCYGKTELQEIVVTGKTILYRLNLNSNIETGNYFFDLANSTSVEIPDEVRCAAMWFFNAVPPERIPKFLEMLKNGLVKKPKFRPLTSLIPHHASMPPMGFPNTLRELTKMKEPFLAFIVEYNGPDILAQVGVASKSLGHYAVGNFSSVNIFSINATTEIIPIVVNDVAPIGTGRLVRGDTNTVTPASIEVENAFFHELGKATLEDFIQIATYDLKATRSVAPEIKEPSKPTVVSKDASSVDALTGATGAIRELTEWLDLDCYSKNGSIKPEAFIKAVKERFLALQTKK